MPDLNLHPSYDHMQEVIVLKVPVWVPHLDVAPTSTLGNGVLFPVGLV